MAERVGESERNGRKTWVYANGLELYQDTGSIAKPMTGTIITRERSTLLHRRRQEKAAALLRARVLQAHNRRMEPVRSSAAAFADSGALLYDEVVLNPDAYPRDRADLWE